MACAQRLHRRAMVQKHSKKSRSMASKAIPEQRKMVILLDSEKLLHAKEAKETMKEYDMGALPNWPRYSPDLNPQEHV